MNDEATPSPAEGAPETTPAEPPSDFKAYVKWRETGALPPKEEQPATAAAGEQPPVKTEPPSEADDSQESEEDKSRPNGRVRRIDKLTRELEQLKAQLASVQTPKPAEPPKPAEASAGDPAKPRLHDFPTLEAYQEALTDWKMDQREKAKQAEAAKAEAEAAQAKLQTGWQNSETAARTAHPDYDEIVQSVRAPDGPGVPAMRQALLEDEAGAEILYYLGTHADEMKKIAALPLASAAREVGRLAAKLTPAPDSGKPKPQHVSSAPRPPAPLSRPSAGSTKKDILDEDFARSDYRGWSREREAQLKGQ
jgi:hypothetical protein